MWEHPGGHGDSLTVVARLGPCQQPVPCSYFMALKRSCSGPAQAPHVLWGGGGDGDDTDTG